MTRDLDDNKPVQKELFPDYMAMVVRMENGERTLRNARWGFPRAPETPRSKVEGKQANIRKPEWKDWLPYHGLEHRCLVPFSRFVEPTKLPDGKSANAYFAIDESRPVAAFAGFYLENWTSVRKLYEGETTNNLFTFLTTDANKEVFAIHEKAMPAILATEEEWETWLTADWSVAKELQRPLPNGSLKSLEIKPLPSRKKG